MTLPDLVVAGVPKAGTTSIYHYLRQHPSVFVPSAPRDIMFFAFDPANPEHVAASRQDFPVRTMAEYESVFAPAGGARVVAEVTPAYFERSGALERLHETLPDARIVLSLREPVGRLYSHAQMNVRLGTADDAVAEMHRLTSIGLGTYAEKLERWFGRFGRERVHVMLFEDLASDAQGSMREVFRFAGVDETVAVRAETVHNPGGLPRSKLMQSLIELRGLRGLRPYAPQPVYELVARLRAANLRKAPALAEPERAAVIARCRDDILATSELIGRDLSAWLR